MDLGYWHRRFWRRCKSTALPRETGPQGQRGHHGAAQRLEFLGCHDPVRRTFLVARPGPAALVLLFPAVGEPLPGFKSIVLASITVISVRCPGPLHNHDALCARQISGTGVAGGALPTFKTSPDDSGCPPEAVHFGNCFHVTAIFLERRRLWLTARVQGTETPRVQPGVVCLHEMGFSLPSRTRLSYHGVVRLCAFTLRGNLKASGFMIHRYAVHAPNLELSLPVQALRRCFPLACAGRPVA